MRLEIAALALALAIPGVASAATYTVNTTVDDNDEVCDPAPGDCTLREAIGGAGPDDLVVLPAGTYVLDPQFGPVTFGEGTTVAGAGARTTIISGGASTRLMDVFDGQQVNLLNLALTSGNGGSELSSGRGGAVYVSEGATLRLTDSAVTGNTASSSGGGIYSEGEVDLVRSTVAYNNAGDGGGIYQANVETGRLTITSSTLSGNRATGGAGGAIFSIGALTIARTTIAGNSAAQGASALSFGGTVDLSDSIVAGTCGGGLSEYASTYNLFIDSSCPTLGTGNRVGDPLLGTLAYNGGQTATHALLAGSPAIGAANPATCSGADQRDVVRPQQGSCDIGAFEYVAPLAPPPPPPPPPPSPSPSPSPPPDDPLPDPVVGKRVNVLTKSGRVRIKLRGRKKFRRLRKDQQVPVGSTIDARKGRITLVTAANRKGRTAKADFYGGIFRITQRKAKRPITTLRLTEKLRCGSRKAKADTAKKKRKRRGKRRRRLWGNGKGRFRTKGRYSSATVRGTKWLVEDRCTKTITRVTRGKVRVRDRIKKKTITLRRGKRYVARKRH